jgi:hypothetical protein
MLFCGWDKLIHGGRVAYNVGGQRRNRDLTAGKNRRSSGRGEHSPELRRDLLGRAAGVAREQRACPDPCGKASRRVRGLGGQRQPHSFRFRRVTHPGDSRNFSRAGRSAANDSPLPFDRFAGLPRHSGAAERCPCFRRFRPDDRGGSEQRSAARFRCKLRDTGRQQHHRTNSRSGRHHHGEPQRHGANVRLERRHCGQRHRSTSFGSECRRSRGYRFDSGGRAPPAGQRPGGTRADDCSNALSSNSCHERCAGSFRDRAGFHRLDTAASVCERSGQSIIRLFGAGQPASFGRGFCFRCVDTCASPRERSRGGFGASKTARNRGSSILRFPASTLFPRGWGFAGNVRVYGTHGSHDGGKRNDGLASGVSCGRDATHRFDRCASGCTGVSRRARSGSFVRRNACAGCGCFRENHSPGTGRVAIRALQFSRRTTRARSAGVPLRTRTGDSPGTAPSARQRFPVFRGRNSTPSSGGSTRRTRRSPGFQRAKRALSGSPGRCARRNRLRCAR